MATTIYKNPLVTFGIVSIYQPIIFKGFPYGYHLALIQSPEDFAQVEATLVTDDSLITRYFYVNVDGDTGVVTCGYENYRQDSTLPKPDFPFAYELHSSNETERGMWLATAMIVGYTLVIAYLATL